MSATRSVKIVKLSTTWPSSQSSHGIAKAWRQSQKREQKEEESPTHENALFLPCPRKKRNGGLAWPRPCSTRIDAKRRATTYFVGQKAHIMNYIIAITR